MTLSASPTAMMRPSRAFTSWMLLTTFAYTGVNDAKRVVCHSTATGMSSCFRTFLMSFCTKASRAPNIAVTAPTSARRFTDEPAIDMFALGDALLERGWYHDRQTPPDNLHSTVSNTNTGVIDDYLADLQECVTDVRTTTTPRSSSCSTAST